MNLELDYNRIGLRFEERKKRVIHFFDRFVNFYKLFLVNCEVENFNNVIQLFIDHV